MINLKKANNDNRVKLFNSLEGKYPSTTINGTKVYFVTTSNNTANIHEDGKVIFEGFKSINEVFKTVNN